MTALQQCDFALHGFYIRVHIQPRH
jgi:hypothetical protein